MKTDVQLRADVLDELKWEPGLDESGIQVAVTDHCVTLTGFVATYAQKCLAEHVVAQATGVRATALELAVCLSGNLQRSDSEIAGAAAHVLRWNVNVPSSVAVAVENGWLTLSGSADWQYQRVAAESALCNLVGIRGVSNEVVVRAHPTIAPAVCRAARKPIPWYTLFDEGLVVHRHHA